LGPFNALGLIGCGSEELKNAFCSKTLCVKNMLELIIFWCFIHIFIWTEKFLRSPHTDVAFAYQQKKTGRYQRSPSFLVFPSFSKVGTREY
jgi:hypothetical protein